MHSSTLVLVLLVAVTFNSSAGKVSLHNYCDGKQPGKYPHPDDCGKFVFCDHHKKEAKEHQCPAFEFFNSERGYCGPDRTTCYLLQGITCYGAKDDTYGKVYATQAGTIQAVKFFHVSGYVTCHSPNANYNSFWGCHVDADQIKQKVNIWITTTRDAHGIVFPPGKGPEDTHNYFLRGYNQQSPVIKIFAKKDHPVKVTKGQELRVWYGEDLKGFSEHDNAGTHCAEVWFDYFGYKPYEFL